MKIELKDYFAYCFTDGWGRRMNFETWWDFNKKNIKSRFKPKIRQITKISEMKETTDMKLTEQVEKEKEILEEKVRESISEFIEKVGDCFIDIKITQEYHEYPDGIKKPISFDVKAEINI